MIVIVSGSRGYHRDEYMPQFEEAMQLSGFTPTKILHGANMDSVDRLARAWARSRGIPEHGIPADWDGVMGRGLPRGAAGPLRNGALEKLGEALVAVWDGESPGTYDMIQKIRRARKPGFVYRLDGAAHERIAAQLGLDLGPPARRR